MLIVMSMENGEIIRAPVMIEADERPAVPPGHLQPQLQIASLPPKAVCPPPSLDIDAFLAAFDA